MRTAATEITGRWCHVAPGRLQVRYSSFLLVMFYGRGTQQTETFGDVPAHKSGCILTAPELLWDGPPNSHQTGQQPGIAQQVSMWSPANLTIPTGRSATNIHATTMSTRTPHSPPFHTNAIADSAMGGPRKLASLTPRPLMLSTDEWQTKERLRQRARRF